MGISGEAKESQGGGDIGEGEIGGEGGIGGEGEGDGGKLGNGGRMVETGT